MSRNAKGWMYVIFAVLIMCITLGYAYLNTELDINGTTNITSANWSIYWDNIQFGSNNVTDITTPATISSGLTEVTFNVNFKEPGDTYEFTVDAVNDGSINAMVSVVSNGVYAANGTTPKTLPDYLEYTVTYSDGIEIAQNHLLEAGETETYKVRVHYKEDITASQLPSTNDNYVFKFSVDYVQATSSAQTVDHSFNGHSWETIINNVRTGNTSNYHAGDTKTVTLGNSIGTHTLRIANTSTPVECSTTGFSQTACGFVLEFADIITTHRTNPSGEYQGTTYNYGWNVDGWPASSMRTYVNTDIYNALPEVIRNAIVNTTVVSGHGSTSGETNFTSTDKLYLLSTHEVWEDVDGNTSSGPDYYDTAYNNTRQLDYYAELNVTTSSYSQAIKKRNGSNSSWWLRSASFRYTDSFHGVNYNGYWISINAYITDGVSPAFRLG